MAHKERKFSFYDVKASFRSLYPTFLLAFFLCLLPQVSFSDEDSVFSPEEMKAILSDVVNELDKIEDEGDLNLIKQAQYYLSAGDIETAELALALFLKSNNFALSNLITFKDIFSPDSVNVEEILLLEQMIINNPSEVAKLVESFIENIMQSIHEINAHHQAHKTIGDRLVPVRLKELGRARNMAQQSLMKLREEIMRANPRRLALFFHQKSLFLLQVEALVNAMYTKSRTSLYRARALDSSINSFVYQDKFFSYGPLQELLSDQEGNQASREIYWQTARGVGVKSSIGVGILALCANPLTTTVGVKAALSVALAGSSTVIVADSSYNLINRTSQLGALRGILSVEGLIDMLLIASLTPMIPYRYYLSTKGRGAIALQEGVRTTFFQKLFNGTLTFTRSVQYQSPFLLAGVVGSQGVWQIANAERIRREYAMMGVYLTESQVRRDGLVKIAFGFLGAARYGSYLRKIKTDSLFAKSMEGLKIRNAVIKPLKFYNPFHHGGRILEHARKIGASVRASIAARGVKAKAGHLLGAGGSSLWILFHSVGIVYDFFIGAFAYFFSFGYLDVLFNSKIDLPELEDGEIVLLLSSFNDQDVLGTAVHSYYNYRRYLEKYELGVNLFIDTFSSGDDFVKKLEFYGKNVGKIKYLKISAHGIPGKIAPTAASIEGDTGVDFFIDHEFLGARKEIFDRIGEEYMAPDAMMVIWSCLVGAEINKNRVIGVNQDVYLNVGDADRLMELIGDTLLQKGGTVYSSRKILIGLDTVYGSLMNYYMRTGLTSDALFGKLDAMAQSFEETERIVAPYQADVIFTEDEREELKTSALNSGAYFSPRMLDVLATQNASGFSQREFDLDMRTLSHTAGTVTSIYKNLFRLISNYGHNIDGKWMKPALRIDRFEPINN